MIASTAHRRTPGSCKDEPVLGTQSSAIDCPYCGERIELSIDCSIEVQEYVEDCSVCCRPIIVTVTTAEGEVVEIDARTESE